MRALIYREILTGVRWLEQSGARLPQSLRVHARVEEAARSWAATVRAGGLPLAAVSGGTPDLRAIVRRSFRHPPPGDPLQLAFRAVRELRQLRCLMAHSTEWQRLLAQQGAGEVTVDAGRLAVKNRDNSSAEFEGLWRAGAMEAGLCLLGAMRDGDPKIMEQRARVSRDLDELAETVRFVYVGTEKEAAARGMGSVERWLRSLNHVLLQHRATKLSLFAPSPLLEMDEGGLAWPEEDYADGDPDWVSSRGRGRRRAVRDGGEVCHVDSVLRERVALPLVAAAVYVAVGARCGLEGLQIIGAPRLPVPAQPPPLRAELRPDDDNDAGGGDESRRTKSNIEFYTGRVTFKRPSDSPDPSCSPSDDDLKDEELQGNKQTESAAVRALNSGVALLPTARNEPRYTRGRGPRIRRRLPTPATPLAVNAGLQVRGNTIGHARNNM